MVDTEDFYGRQKIRKSTKKSAQEETPDVELP
jgi:hypothetical protein